jgi:hypothetical protein
MLECARQKTRDLRSFSYDFDFAHSSDDECSRYAELCGRQWLHEHATTSWATTHPIEYHIGCPPSMVNTAGTLEYFKEHGFTAVHLVVPDKGTYQAELNRIKSLGMKPIFDIEIPIWTQDNYRARR